MTSSSINVAVGHADQPLHGEDRLLHLRERHVFGVFDGLGGEVAGDVAAETAAGAVARFYEREATSSAESAADVEMQRARAALEAAEAALEDSEQANPRWRGMATTASIMRLFRSPDGVLQAAYAHVGDTRIYLMRGGRVRRLTRDEGAGTMIDNCLGFLRSIEQVDVVGLEPGDRLVLCSDGITGDYADELLSDEEIEKALSGHPGPSDAAQELVRISRKRDDKSVLVIDVEG